MGFCGKLAAASQACSAHQAVACLLLHSLFTPPHSRPAPLCTPAPPQDMQLLGRECKEVQRQTEEDADREVEDLKEKWVLEGAALWCTLRCMLCYAVLPC